jgi:hypothetical protein
MKKIIFVLIAVSLVYALTKTSPPYRFTANTSARSSEVNANFDTLDHTIDKIIDTVNNAVMRFNPTTTSRDSVLKFVGIDTIKSNPWIDSIQGNPILDSLRVLTGIRAIASIRGDSLLSDKGARIEYSLSADSILTNGVRCDNSISTDSILFNGLRGTASATVDSLISKGGRFTASASVDSLIAKGIRATASIRGDSMISDKGMRAVGTIKSSRFLVGTTDLAGQITSNNGDSGISVLGNHIDGTDENGTSWGKLELQANSTENLSLCTGGGNVIIPSGYTTLGGNTGVKFYAYRHVVTANDVSTNSFAPKVPITTVVINKVYNMVAEWIDVSSSTIFTTQSEVIPKISNVDSLGAVLGATIAAGDTVNIGFFTIP